jgi:hypothetical protein
MNLRLKRRNALRLVERVLAAADEIVCQRWEYLCEPVASDRAKFDRFCRVAPRRRERPVMAGNG